MQNTMAKYTISFSSGMCMSSMPVWKPALSMTSRQPMATMNVSASIFISGCPLMKLEMGSMKIIMRNTASMTAMIMMMRWSAMPTAVMTESMENTRSMTMMVPTACGSAMRWSALCSSQCSALSSVSLSVSRSSAMPL